MKETDPLPLVKVTTRGAVTIHYAVDKSYGWLNGYRTMEKAPGCGLRVDITSTLFQWGTQEDISCGSCRNILREESALAASGA